MVTNPVVVFDIDGVLADFTWAFTSRAAEMGLVEKPWHSDEQSTWDFDFEAGPVFKAIAEDPNFWSTLPALATWLDRRAMHWAAEEEGIQPLYMTARGGVNAAPATVDWLNDMGFPRGPVFVVKGAPKDKLPFIKTIRHQVVGLIDDNVEMIEKCRDAGRPIVARRALYNAHVTGVPFVSSVGEFVAGLRAQCAVRRQSLLLVA